jgi:thiamine biosynthesis protein ThiS
MTADEGTAGVGLPRPCLMLVTDRQLAGGEEALVRAVDEAIRGGVNVVQLREKELDDDHLRTLGRRLRGVTLGRALLLVNGAAEVAIEVGADGVHLPEDAPGVDIPLILGRSVHSVEAAVRAEGEGVDYLVAGPVFETRSHEGAPAAGVELIRKICEAVRLPVLGIGGVDYQRAAEVTRAGAVGVAVISAILSVSAPREAARGLKESLNRIVSRGGLGEMVMITLNGKPRELAAPVAIPELLESLQVTPRQVAVAINGEVVKRTRWPDVSVEDGDVVEVVRAVGGG